MTIRRADTGAVLTKAALDALTTDVPDPDPMVTVPIDVWQDYTIGEGTDPDPSFEGGRRRVFYAGQKVSQAYIDGLFPTADILSVTPNTGLAAGGTPITIKGKNFAGATGATVGGNALAGFVLHDNETITGTTAAHTAGAVNVVVTDDGGPVTEVNGFTFT